MYVPILKNRTVEISVLQQLGMMNVFDNNVIPLIELIQKKTRSNNKNTFIQDLCLLLDKCPKMHTMVDFYKSTNLRRTTDPIREYVTMTVRIPGFCADELIPLISYRERVIPVVSYLSESISLERIENEATLFRANFPHIAFRIKVQEFEHVFSCVEQLITSNDYLILDIESASYTSPVIRKISKKISESKKLRHFTSVIINAHRPENVTNKSRPDGEPIAEIDNSLRELYASSYMNKFDAFGDYACISSALPSTGGAISPVGIYYSNENNYFVSYKGRAPQLSEFPTYIAPRIMESEYWAEFSPKHHQNCPGCMEITEIVSGVKSGRNQAQWKMITMLHYIYTMFETSA